MTPQPHPGLSEQTVLTGTLWPLGTSGTLLAGTFGTERGRKVSPTMEPAHPAGRLAGPVGTGRISRALLFGTQSDAPASAQEDHDAHHD